MLLALLACTPPQEPVEKPRATDTGGSLENTDDMDGDGWTFETDCDDEDAAVYPGAPEIEDDLVDQDCDGGDLGCADVRAFQPTDGEADYTELQEACALGYDGVSGDVLIEGIADAELTGVDCLCEVSGELHLWDNEALVSLAGLARLERVQFLGVIRNTALTGVDLPNLESAGTLALEANALTSLAGLSGLEDWGGLRLYEEDALTGLGLAFPAPSAPVEIVVHGNDALTSLTGLEEVTEISALSVSGNDSLASLEGLDGVTSLGTLDATYADLSSLSGLEGVTVAERITIEGGSGLADASGLDGLVRVGDLTITGTSMTSLAGLDALEEVTNELLVEDNDDLVDLTGLGGLREAATVALVANGLGSLAGLGDGATVETLHVERNGAMVSGGRFSVTEAGDVTIVANDALVDLAGWEDLSRVTGTLDVKDNTALATLQGLDGLAEAEVVSITANPSLSTLPLEGMEEVGELSIEGNRSLTSLSFPRLAAVDTLTIQENAALTSLSGLDMLASVDHAVVSGNALASLDGLGGLVYAFNVDVTDEPIVTLWGLSPSLELEGVLYLSGLDELTSLDGLAYGSLGELWLSDDASLATLEGVEDAGLITTLTLDGLFELRDLAGFEDLVVRPPDTIEIHGNGLRSLEGLDAFGELVDLWISDEDSLMALGDLPGLVHVTGGLYLENLAVLRSLDGLEALTEVSETLSIDSNEDLSDVSALHGLVSVGALNIVDNPSLATADAEALRDAIDVIEGTVTIARNGP